MTPSLALSMAPLASELLALLSYRADRIADMDAPPGAEELAALKGEIQRYFEALPRKVDGTAAVLRGMKFSRQQIAAEIKRLEALDAHVKREEAELTGYVTAVLEEQPAPRDGSSKKLEGTYSTLLLKKNGSVQPLVISAPIMVPDELCRFEGQFSYDQQFSVRVSLRRAGWDLDDIDALFSRFARVPSNSLVREALLQSCATCDGTGEGLGCVTMAEQGEPPERCSVCGGSGRNAVPGAHLEPRGSHLEVK